MQTKAPSKTYSLRGKVVQIYEPREIKKQYGPKLVTKYVTDLYLQLETGAKVKVSFWDTDVSGHENASVVLSHLTYSGKYKDTPQYSSTKNTTITITGKTAKAAAPAAEEVDDTPEGAEPSDEPTFAEPGGDGVPEEEVPEGAVSEEEVAQPAPVKKAVAAAPAAAAPVKAKRAAKPATTAGAFAVSADVIAMLTEISGTAVKIANHTADPLIKSDAKAFQAFASTIFIELARKDFFDKKGSH